MLDPIIRLVKRFAVLIPGLVVAYFVATDIYPLLGRNIPSAFALLFAYIIAAYILIPALMRLVRFFIKPKHIPLYCTTPDGFASDPINIGLEGTRDQVIEAMSSAGWFMADERNIKSLFKMSVALLFRQSYPHAPFSNLYLFGRSQDFGFQLPINHSPHHRHHVRFWVNAPRLSNEQEDQLKFWQKYMPIRHTKQRQLWLGAASFDVGLGLIRHNAQITHMIHPDTDAERDLIVRHLKTTGTISKIKQITVGQPYNLRNRVLRGRLNADGKMTIVTLKG